MKRFVEYNRAITRIKLSADIDDILILNIFNATMAFDEHFAERIRTVLKKRKAKFEERRMMGGLCILVNEKMCVGIIKDQLMARVGPDAYKEALRKKGCREMDFAKKPMIGYVYVDPFAVDADDDLEYWVDLCLKFNPQAKSSKK